MSKHTPGPWTAEKWGHKSDTYGTGWSIRPYNHKTGEMTGFQLAVVDGDDYPLAQTNAMGGTSEANARLIAAAPEMLRALEEIRSETQDWFNDEYTSTADYADAVGTIVKAAIAKAKGQA